MKQPTPLLISLSILALGQLTLAQSAKAQANLSDIGGDSSSRDSQVINSTSAGGDVSATVDNTETNTNAVNAVGATGDFGLSQEVINLIPNVSLNDAFGNNSSPSGNGSSGASGTTDNSTTSGTTDNSTTSGTTDNSTTSGTTDNSTTGEDGILNEVNSTEIVICASDPCLPSEDGGKAITLNDLAKLIEEDLSRSLDDLATARTLEREIVNQPRRILRGSSIRRRDSSTCISPVVEARREVTTKVEQSRDFADFVQNNFDPNYSPW